MERPLIIILVFVLMMGLGALEGMAAEPVQRTFVVHCYDVGIDVLKDKPGVLQVKRTWRDLEETNIVAYDPDQVSVEQLEGWLKQADTYLRTLPEGTR